MKQWRNKNEESDEEIRKTMKEKEKEKLKLIRFRFAEIRAAKKDLFLNAQKFFLVSQTLSQVKTMTSFESPYNVISKQFLCVQST